MAGTQTIQYGYLTIPYSLMSRKMAASQLLARASVYSLSSQEREQYGLKKRKNSVNFTVSAFSKRYNVSTATARRALTGLDCCENIEKTEEGYFFDADKMKESYLHVDEWLFFATFSGEYLTKSEVLVLARMISLAKKGTKIKASYRYIARGLGLSHTLVMNAAEKLERLGILNIITRARNKYDRTTFIIEKEYLQSKKAEMERTLRSGTSSSREEYYSKLRQIAYDRRQAMFKKACNDVVFTKTYKRWFDDKANAELQAILFERLASMGMSWRDIVLQHSCAKCKDTGTLKDGNLCDCYDMNK